MKNQRERKVAIFFIATPLHYLAAQKVALLFEEDSRCIAIPYTPSAQKYIDHSEWGGVVYAPWPRFSPMPGAFGRHRRLLANLRNVANEVGTCSTLTIHSPVFDTEAVNYYLRGLPRLCNIENMRARILPDGLLNISRHPRNRIAQAGLILRKLRKIASPQLDYWHFSGDRIGSDAPFVDRIYTLAGFPHDYPKEKVVALPPLLSETFEVADNTVEKSALLIGQPLMGIGALTSQEHGRIVREITSWLAKKGITKVVYKAHPRDPNQELRVDGSIVLDIREPLERHMSKNRYHAVLGVNSTALYLARQIYGPEVSVISFGNDLVHFKNADQGKKAAQLMDLLGIQRR